MIMVKVIAVTNILPESNPIGHSKFKLLTLISETLTQEQIFFSFCEQCRVELCTHGAQILVLG